MATPTTTLAATLTGRNPPLRSDQSTRRRCSRRRRFRPHPRRSPAPPPPSPTPNQQRHAHARQRTSTAARTRRVCINCYTCLSAPRTLPTCRCRSISRKSGRTRTIRETRPSWPLYSALGCSDGDEAAPRPAEVPATPPPLLPAPLPEEAERSQTRTTPSSVPVTTAPVDATCARTAHKKKEGRMKSSRAALDGPNWLES